VGIIGKEKLAEAELMNCEQLNKKRRGNSRINEENSFFTLTALTNYSILNNQ